jgi:threonine/homoserine/homoserine lactone efflux protein
MESLLFLLKGILIGLVVGFPSGPVGFIYIKRATTGGFLSGFISGIGSTFAHLVYVIALLYAYSEILEIYSTHEELLTFIFSTFLIILGIIIFCSEKKKSPDGEDAETLYGYFLSAFGITLTNPMEIIQFSFLFTFFGIFGAIHPRYVLVIIGIALGSLFWPAISSFGISRTRHTVSSKKIEYLQKLIGTVVIIIGLFFIFKNFT